MLWYSVRVIRVWDVSYPTSVGRLRGGRGGGGGNPCLLVLLSRLEECVPCTDPPWPRGVGTAAAASPAPGTG